MDMDLKAVEAEERRRSERKENEFAALVAAIDRGESPGPGEIVDALERCGKTKQDLAAAVAKRKKLAQLRSEAAKRPELVERRKALEANKEGILRRAEAARQRSDAELAAAEAELAQVEAALERATAAKAELTKSPEFANPELVERRRQLNAEREVVSADLQHWRRQYMTPAAFVAEEAYDRGELQNELRVLGGSDPARAAQIEAALADLPARTKRRQERLAALERLDAALVAQIAAVEQEMISDA